MQKSFDGLAGQVRNFLGADPFSGQLFALPNRRGDINDLIAIALRSPDCDVRTGVYVKDSQFSSGSLGDGVCSAVVASRGV